MSERAMSSNQDLSAARAENNAGRTPAVASVAQRRADVPNWYDGPITMWVIVDGSGKPFAFDNQRVASETLDRWEQRLPEFGPYRLITLVEQREGA
jgi:hypothetical protein